MSRKIVQLTQVSKRFTGMKTPALEAIDLSLEQGQLLALLGPSGCGKTTLLRSIAGFETPDSGTIALAGQSVAAPGIWIPPEQRRVGMVFQEYALFPHLTVAENIAFGLQQSLGKQPAIVKERTRDAIALVGLEGLDRRYPHELSGGQRQRVALARALAPRPLLMLLDEPLSNLDAQVRMYLRNEVRRILKDAQMTAIFVTHDREEALAISDVVGVMQQGCLEQLDTPETIYAKPASRFVAQFVTQANFFSAQRRGNLWETEVGCFEVDAVSGNGNDEGEVMIREEDLQFQLDEGSDVQICDRQFLGREYRYCAISPSGQRFHARITAATNLAIGTRVKLSVSPRQLRVFC